MELDIERLLKSRDTHDTTVAVTSPGVQYQRHRHMTITRTVRFSLDSQEVQNGNAPSRVLRAYVYVVVCARACVRGRVFVGGVLQPTPK